MLLNAAWRAGVVLVCFSAFSLGGLLISLLLFPLLRLLPGDRHAQERRARGVVRLSFAALLCVLQAARILRMEVRNGTRLGQPGAVLVLANHPSYLDVVVLVAHVRDAVCVVKSKFWSNPFFGGVVRAAGYIRNDQPERLVGDCAERLAAGLPLIMFPEGTRSAQGQPLHFVRGAAHIALATGVPIQPVLLAYEPAVLPRGAKWYQLPLQASRVSVDVLPRTDAGTLLTTQPRPGARRLTQALERFFTDRLECHERPAA